jgi:hypothetical protein
METVMLRVNAAFGLCLLWAVPPAWAQMPGPFAGPGVPSYNPGVPSYNPGVPPQAPGSFSGFAPGVRSPRRGTFAGPPVVVVPQTVIIVPQRRQRMDPFFGEDPFF